MQTDASPPPVQCCSCFDTVQFISGNKMRESFVRMASGRVAKDPGTAGRKRKSEFFKSLRSSTQFYSFSFPFLQIDYIRRRQHISTIDTSSPQRGGNTTSGVGSLSNSTNQTYAAASIPMHAASHAPVNYCTLRNGTQSASLNSSVTMVS